MIRRGTGEEGTAQQGYSEHSKYLFHVNFALWNICIKEPNCVIKEPITLPDAGQMDAL